MSNNIEKKGKRRCTYYEYMDVTALERKLSRVAGKLFIGNNLLHSKETVFLIHEGFIRGRISVSEKNKVPLTPCEGDHSSPPWSCNMYGEHSRSIRLSDQRNNLTHSFAKEQLARILTNLLIVAGLANLKLGKRKILLS